MRDFLAEAKALHDSAIVLDGHADTPQRFIDEAWQWRGSPLGIGQLSAETATAGHLHGGFLIAWPEPDAWAGRFAARTRALIAGIHAQAAANPDSFSVCTTAAEVRAAKAAHRYAALIGVEGGHAIENNLETIRQFHSEGARYMTLTWANANDWCGSSGYGGSGGLTSFGRDVVREMNRIGMIVDVSHVSDAAFHDVLETSSAPVIASHSSSRHVCPAARNLTDEMAQALAAKGGVVMVNFFAAFVSDDWRKAWNATKPDMNAALVQARQLKPRFTFFDELAIERHFAKRIPPAPFSLLVDHFDHLLKLVGTRHVGIGSDFDGIALSVEGMETAADLPKLTAALLERGWPADDLRGMLGENLLRVLQQVEDHATA